MNRKNPLELIEIEQTIAPLLEDRPKIDFSLNIPTAPDFKLDGFVEVTDTENVKIDFPNPPRSVPDLKLAGPLETIDIEPPKLESPVTIPSQSDLKLANLPETIDIEPPKLESPVTIPPQPDFKPLEFPEIADTKLPSIQIPINEPAQIAETNPLKFEPREISTESNIDIPEPPESIETEPFEIPPILRPRTPPLFRNLRFDQTPSAATLPLSDISVPTAPENPRLENLRIPTSETTIAALNIPVLEPRQFEDILPIRLEPQRVPAFEAPFVRANLPPLFNIKVPEEPIDDLLPPQPEIDQEVPLRPEGLQQEALVKQDEQLIPEIIQAPDIEIDLRPPQVDAALGQIPHVYSDIGQIPTTNAELVPEVRNASATVPMGTGQPSGSLTAGLTPNVVRLAPGTRFSVRIGEHFGVISLI